MKRHLVVIAALAVGLLQACPETSPEAHEAASQAESSAPQRSTDQQTTQDPPMKLQTLDASLVATTVEDGGSIAVVRVASSEIEHGNTRSESVRIHCELVTALHGKVLQSLTLRRYTRGGDRVLVTGRLYIVALYPDPRFAPAQDLLGFVEVPESQLAESIKAHSALIPAAKPN